MTSTLLDWAEVMGRVPRERFIPDVIWRQDTSQLGNDLVPVDRRSDPDTWAAMVASDEPVTTQVDGGRPAGDGPGWEPTSSCSDRRVVAEMLRLLDPAPGEHVLEIGTGTGWNAAILAEAGVRVTTVEVDPWLAASARRRLAEAGYGDVAVIVDDGARVEIDADHVIATVGVAEVPWSWVAHTRVGGRIVAPLTNPWQPPGIACLHRAATGAAGRLAGPAAFMPMRGREHRIKGVDFTEPAEHVSTTDVHPHCVAGDRDAATAIGQRVSGISRVWRSTGGEVGTLWLYGNRSWASLAVTPASPPYEVEQAGPRQLWDEVYEAYQWWCDQGKPTVADWEVAVTADGQGIRLRTDR